MTRPSTDAHGRPAGDSLLRRTLAALAAGLLALTGACGSEGDASDDPTGSGAAGVTACVDPDGDGFGVGCARGTDCNDDDPKITSECYRCAHPGVEGCPCDDDGAMTECGVLQGTDGATVTCGFGKARCAQGHWGTCDVDVTRSRVLSGAGLSPQGLGPSQSCNLPCDPY